MLSSLSAPIWQSLSPWWWGGVQQHTQMCSPAPQKLQEREDFPYANTLNSLLCWNSLSLGQLSSFNQLPQTREWDALIDQALVSYPLLKHGWWIVSFTQSCGLQLPGHEWLHETRAFLSGAWKWTSGWQTVQLMIIVDGTQGVLSCHSISLVVCSWMLSTGSSGSLWKTRSPLYAAVLFFLPLSMQHSLWPWQAHSL